MDTETQVTLPPIRTSWLFIANSLLAAVVAVVIAHLIEQVGLGITGWMAGRDPLLTNTGTVFRGPGSDLAYAGGTMAAIAAGTFLLLLYPGARDRSAGRLTLLWVILHSFRIAFVHLARVLFDSDAPVSRALASVDLPAGIDVLLAVTGIIGLVLVALAAAPAFLGFARHESEVRTPQRRVRFLTFMALIPGVVAPIAAVAFLLGDEMTSTVKEMPFVGLFTVVTVGAGAVAKSFRAPDVPQVRGLSWGLAVSAILLFLFFRFVISTGIPIPPLDENLDFVFE